MNRLKLSLGVVIVAAMAFSAFAATASAAPTLSQEHCVTEAGTTGSFTTNQCTTESGTGTFHWKATSGATVLKPFNATAFTLKSTNGGIIFTIKCTGLTGSGTSTPGGTSIAGSGITLTYTGCTVTEPAGKSCVVRGSTNAAGSGEISTASLKSTLVGLEPTTSEPMYKITYLPTSGTAFTTIVVSGCTSAPLNGNKEVTGEAVGTIKAAGRVQEFTSTSGSKLKFGGQESVFTGTNEVVTNSGGAAVRIATP